MTSNHSHPTVLTTVPDNFKQLLHDTWEKQFASWPDYADGDTFHQAALRETERALGTFAGKVKRPSLVDLGCGSGHFLRNIRKRFRWSQLAGVDYCTQALTRADNLDVSGLPRIDYVRRDLELPVSAEEQVRLGRFDFAAATFVVDEIDNIEAFFATARALLHPKGRLVCAMLDEARERTRHSLNPFPSATGSERVIIKQVKTDPYGVDLEYYRIIRPRGEPISAATRAGLVCEFDRSSSPAELGSRLDGPSLRLLGFWNQPAS